MTSQINRRSCKLEMFFDANRLNFHWNHLRCMCARACVDLVAAKSFLRTLSSSYSVSLVASSERESWIVSGYFSPLFFFFFFKFLPEAVAFLSACFSSISVLLWPPFFQSSSFHPVQRLYLIFIKANFKQHKFRTEEEDYVTLISK